MTASFQVLTFKTLGHQLAILEGHVDPQAVHMVFVVGKVILRQVFL
jgi:hypothetical protein